MVVFLFISDLDRIQTYNLLSRNQVHYSVMLRGHFEDANIELLLKFCLTIHIKNVNDYFWNMIDKQLLQKFDYIFDDKLINTISEVGMLREFDKDDIIIDLDQELKYIPLLIEGNIKIIREDENGHDIVIYYLESGDTCAMSLTCCLQKSKSKIRAIADEDSRLIMIPVAKNNEWFNNNESWRNFILESYQVRFNEMLETIDSLAFLKLDERLLKYLTDKVKLTASTTLLNTHQEIAEDLNTSRVVISRLLKQLENEGKISLARNKIEVEFH